VRVYSSRNVRRHAAVSGASKGNKLSLGCQCMDCLPHIETRRGWRIIRCQPAMARRAASMEGWRVRDANAVSPAKCAGIGPRHGRLLSLRLRPCSKAVLGTFL
jgi:hypothetical protein